MEYLQRTYRSLINKDCLVSYNVKIHESDLFISSDKKLEIPVLESLANHRNILETYIKSHPDFRTSLLPLSDDKMAPPIIRKMLASSNVCGVGPMAGIAGAVAEFVGMDLVPLTDNIIIENGGDIFIKSQNNRIVSVFAGTSPLSYKVNFMIKPEMTPIGVCTSSATVGPSLSFGIADAVCVISSSSTLADAAASAIGNQIKKKRDIKKALERGIEIPGVQGVVVIVGAEMGVIGQVELV